MSLGTRSFADDPVVVSTPGHTPGHQSVMIDDGDDGRTVLVGQACYTCNQFVAGEVHGDNVHDDSWMSTALESLQRLRSLRPLTAHFSHDATPYHDDRAR